MKTAAGIRLVRGNHLVWSSVTSAKYLWARGLDGLADRLLTIGVEGSLFSTGSWK
jgi:hypothetical protein